MMNFEKCTQMGGRTTTKAAYPAERPEHLDHPKITTTQRADATPNLPTLNRFVSITMRGTALVVIM